MTCGPTHAFLFYPFKKIEFVLSHQFHPRNIFHLMCYCETSKNELHAKVKLPILHFKNVFNVKLSFSLVLRIIVCLINSDLGLVDYRDCQWCHIHLPFWRHFDFKLRCWCRTGDLFRLSSNIHAFILTNSLCLFRILLIYFNTLPFIRQHIELMK